MSASRKELDEVFAQTLAKSQPVIFKSLLSPNGVLNSDPACHALWQYAVIVNRRLEEKNSPQYEDAPIDYMRDLKNTFMSLAILYKTTPEKMTRFWVNVDMQMRLMNSQIIPKEYRFDEVADVRTQ